jgi:hypothetical protein
MVVTEGDVVSVSNVGGLEARPSEVEVTIGVGDGKRGAGRHLSDSQGQQI